MFDGSLLWKLKDDKSGLEFQFTESIESAYKELFDKIFPGINTEAQTPIGQIITHLTEQDSATISAIQDLMNYFFLGGEKQLLDIWAYNQFRATRKQGISGSVLIDIQGVPNTKINKGFTISDNEMRYILDKDLIINEKGKAQALFIAEYASEKISLANTITQIITNVIGIEKVNNPNASNAGILTESDSAFYLRCQKYGSLFKNSSFASILANVANLQGVKRIGGYENASKAEVIKNGFKIAPFSFIIIVEGGDSRKICETIAQCKPPGAGMMGDTEEKLIINTKEIIYKFQRPKEALMKAEISVKTSINSPSIYAEQVKQAVINYINSLEIGDYITQPALSQQIAKETSGFDIQDVKIGRKTEAVGYNPIQLNLDELATISQNDILVSADNG